MSDGIGVVVLYLVVGFILGIGCRLALPNKEDEELIPLAIMAWPILLVGAVLLGVPWALVEGVKRVAGIFPHTSEEVKEARMALDKEFPG